MTAQMMLELHALAQSEFVRHAPSDGLDNFSVSRRQDGTIVLSCARKDASEIVFQIVELSPTPVADVAARAVLAARTLASKVHEERHINSQFTYADFAKATQGEQPEC